MLLHTLSTAGEANLKDSPSSRVPCSPIFRPLPPLPEPSTLQLPSFLNFSTQSFPSPADPPPRRSTASLPASALLRVSPSPVASCVAARNTNIKVFEGPQWIPAFHHPNSPYVPWSYPVRRRILPLSSPLPASPVCPSPCTRSGAVAPEPWASSTFSQAHRQSGKERLSSSWKSFRNSIKKGVKTVVSRIGKSRTSLRTLCTSQDMLYIYDDTDIQPNCGPRDSLASFASSDSATLEAWLAERRATASRVIDYTPREMSVEEYELAGSWLDLRHCDGGWVCGVQDCDMHTAGGSPCTANEYPNVLRTAMPFDSADLLPSPIAPVWPFPAGPFAAPPRFHSLPRLPCQSFDLHSAQPTTAARCLARCRELSMPGGWTFY
jgi:hypothetical protein